MNERHTFVNVHLRAKSHILIKGTNPVVSVLLSPRVARHEREEMHERYYRAVLTLFVSCRSAVDLCVSTQTWSEAFEFRKLLISADCLKTVDHIQPLHEFKND